MPLDDPETGYGSSAFVKALHARLPADGQAWATAHERERFPDGPAMALAFVDAHRWRANAAPDGSWVRLAEALVGLGEELSEAGRREDAAAAMTEAFEICRQLTSVDLAAYGWKLCPLVNTLRFHFLYEPDRTVEVLGMAVAVYRKFAEADLMAYGHRLVKMCELLLSELSSQCRYEEGVGITAVLIETIRRLTAGVVVDGSPTQEATESVLCRILTGHSGWVQCLAISPDGSRLATVGDDEFLRVWDTVTGRPDEP